MNMKGRQRLRMTLVMLLAAGISITSPMKYWRSTASQFPPFCRLRGGSVPPLVQELFDLGFDKSLYTRTTFYNEQGQRIAPPDEGLDP